MKKRFLFNDIIKYLDHKNALVITGMRQVGKTTLMRQIFDEVDSHKLWFDFDNPLDLLHFENIDYDAIFQTLSREASIKNERLFVFIDEIQNYPEITKIIKYHIDKFNVKYIVTGSSNYYLKNLFPESLSGRKFLFILHPLSFKEYLYFNEKREESYNQFDIDNVQTNAALLEYKKYEFDYIDYIEFGGFPEVVVTKDIGTKGLILKNIFSSFFEKDIRVIADVKDIRELRDLILLLVPRTGNIIDVTKLADELGVNRVKIYNYLELLQGLFFISLIPKYSKSIDRSVAGGRKVYFTDTGLLNIIGKVNEGQLFENAIAVQLKNFGEISYYNKRNTAEIDFILDKKTAFEVKIKSSENDLTRLKKIAERIGITNYYLISKKFSETSNTVYPQLL